MPETFQIAGPTVVKIGASTLGYSDNDTLPSISIVDHLYDVRTVLSGETPEEIVYRGTEARIAVALVKWDQAVLASMLNTQRGAAGSSPVGRRIVGNSASFSLTIESTTGTSKYVFSTAFVQPDGHNDSQWGNRERVLTLTFRAIPASAGGTLYTYTA